MIKMLLNGCNGKMGKVISEMAKDSATISIVAGVDRDSSNLDYPCYDSILKCKVDVDVILDFSRPDALDSLCTYSKEKNIPIVFCTTGFSPEQLLRIDSLSKEIPVFHSANMSIGINIVNNLLKNISKMLYKDFDIEIIEKHHNQKVDAPSGTALLLANTIKDSINDDMFFVKGRDGSSKRQPKEIGIHAIRGGNIIGDHEVIFAGKGECIEIKHTAISRDVFAIGSLKACEFIYGKNKGLYNMDDVVNLSL
ncbi:4-hydroxy-tetrahydrodipicolinate reductase [Clostridium estertheticum]|uniref:4-hydroxy-tetrahydrodipicolinate reductase n=1 Tax=Clostridium estertheticum TaxID=238834 RepID=UPI001C0D1E06|nr:4-hydroxy-tetrahydrodipicolinate reductase [Clostridium estertheticum]MBU3199624.1 4-hydroxy-tetrahydrodipicolinate reductase [Clostridium estertheticum]WAG65308.1 4-hydroxy-tetrahydrodipicolinate reductase [Clostridium estertheticum]